MTDNILIILSAAFLLFAGLCVPFLIQILRTAREMAMTLQLLNQRLPLIMKNLEEITTNINRTSITVHRQVAEISLTLNRIQGIIGFFLGLEEVLRRRMSFPFARTLRTSMAVGRGVRVFLDCFTGGGPEGKSGSSS
ncbi:MAG: hypothetical protein ABIJ25_08075 [Pseudomonadota bacterium]